MTLHLYTGNRMEVLADALAGVLQRNPVPVFESERIVVQSRGMQRWLSMRLAARFGVWAGADYPFPNRLVQQLFDWLGLSRTDSEKFSKEA
ncbi:MAG: exodeoxyribonuclease V subunit gamma, partial [Chlorobium sp.]|uniref:exodeoxyribonuclease V subunit gamma n=1 Tax=Chlorobium sp. TaxID=1095 RepID=UPI0025BF9A0B